MVILNVFENILYVMGLIWLVSISSYVLLKIWAKVNRGDSQ